jgi:hypothetical protein
MLIASRRHRNSYRAAVVTPFGQHAHPRCQRNRRAAARTSTTAAYIPRIAGRAEKAIGGVDANREFRSVGLGDERESLVRAPGLLNRLFVQRRYDRVEPWIVLFVTMQTGVDQLRGGYLAPLKASAELRR